MKSKLLSQLSLMGIKGRAYLFHIVNSMVADDRMKQR